MIVLNSCCYLFGNSGRNIDRLLYITVIIHVCCGMRKKIVIKSCDVIFWFVLLSLSEMNSGKASIAVWGRDMEMRMLRWMCGVAKKDKNLIRNEHDIVRGSVKVARVSKKITEKRLKWYEHVKRREEGHVLRRM